MSKHTASESLGDFTVTPRFLLISLLAIAIGLLSTGVAFGSLRLISLFTNLFYFQRWSTAAASPAQNTLGGYAVLVPIAGALIIGLIARYGSERIRGHGNPRGAGVDSYRRQPRSATFGYSETAVGSDLDWIGRPFRSGRPDPMEIAAERFQHG